MAAPVGGDHAVAAAVAAARVLCAVPGSSDPGSWAAADAHLRAAQASPDGWRVGRALLVVGSDEPRVRAMGASMLRAKARSDGFALSTADATAMTRELLAMMLPSDPATSRWDPAMGPHLAALAASVAAAGGAETLAALVRRAIDVAAPDGDGGWSGGEDATAAGVGVDAPAAVALLVAAAEEGLHRPRAHASATTRAMQDALEDVLWVLEAILTSCGEAAAASDVNGNEFSVVVALVSSAFTCLRTWHPAGVTLSELFADRGALFNALVLGAVGGAWGGDARVVRAATEALEELMRATDPLPSRADAVRAVMDVLEDACGALTAGGALDAGWDFLGGDGDGDDGDDAMARIRAATAIASAVAGAETTAFAARAGGGVGGGGGGGGGIGSSFGNALEWLLTTAERGDAAAASAALAPWRPGRGGLASALGDERGRTACERVLGSVLRRSARTAGASWRAAALAAAAAATDSDATPLGPTCDIDDDDALDLARARGPLETAIAAAHDAMGSPAFLRVVVDALEGAAAAVGPPPEHRGWENARAALVALACCGYPLASEPEYDVDVAPGRPAHVEALTRALVTSPIGWTVVRAGAAGCQNGPRGCAPLVAARAVAVAATLSRVVSRERRAPFLAPALEFLLDAMETFSGPDADDVAVASVAADAAATTIRAAAEAPGDDAARAVAPCLDRAASIASSGGALPTPHRVAIVSALCVVATRLGQEVGGVVDALVAAPLRRLGAAVAAGDARTCALELKVLSRAFAAEGALARASDDALRAMWETSTSVAAMARDAIASGTLGGGGGGARDAAEDVVRGCRDLWIGLTRARPRAREQAHESAALAAARGLFVGGHHAGAPLPPGTTPGTTPRSLAVAALSVAAAVARDVGAGATPRTREAILEVITAASRTLPTSDDDVALARALFETCADVLNASWIGVDASRALRVASPETFRAACLECRAAEAADRAAPALTFIETCFRATTSTSTSTSTASFIDDPEGTLDAMRTLAASLAVAAAGWTSPSACEPIGAALWAASEWSRRRDSGSDGAAPAAGGSAWLARVLSRAVTTGEGLAERGSPATAAGAAGAADVDAFARAVATRAPPHGALRLGELVHAFGRAVRGVGPAELVREFA